jgi:hypothetical protein
MAAKAANTNVLAAFLVGWADLRGAHADLERVGTVLRTFAARVIHYSPRFFRMRAADAARRLSG